MHLGGPEEVVLVGTEIEVVKMVHNLINNLLVLNCGPVVGPCPYSHAVNKKSCQIQMDHI